MAWIDELRKQSPENKSRMAIISAFSATALIALVWLTTIPARFADIGTGVTETSKQTALIQDAVSPTPAPEKQKTAAEVMTDKVNALLKDIKRPEQTPEVAPKETVEHAPVVLIEATSSKAVQPESTVGQPVLIETRTSAE